MSELRTSESPQSDPFQNRLESWLNQKNQGLLEEVMAAWQGALERFQPDASLLESLRQAAEGDKPEPSEARAGSGTSDRLEAQLAAALDLIEGATSQSDLLKRLLDALVPFVERSAIFILKQGLASFYAHRGFEGNAPAKPGAVVPPAELEAVIQGLSRSLRQKGPAYAALLSPISPFEASEAVIFPLRHKKKAVALLLVDSGLRQRLDYPDHVRALVLAASAMLAALAAGREDEPKALPLPTPTPNPEPPTSAPTQVVPEPIEPAAPQELDSRTRAAAERLARVLVGDVELYFPAKVALARTKGNLYGLLRDELDRSRANFVERFGEEVEAQHRIFTTTLIQLLCDGDGSKLGTPPWK